MSVTANETADQCLSVFRFPFRRLGAGIALVLGLLIPTIYEMDKLGAARRLEPLEKLALLTAAVTVCVSPIARYQIDPEKRQIKWWQIGLNGWRGGTDQLVDQNVMGPVERFPLRQIGWYRTTVRGKKRDIVIPLSGWKEDSEAIHDRIEQALDASFTTTSRLPKGKRQFSLWTAFGLITIACVILAITRSERFETVSILAYVGILGVFGSTMFFSPAVRSRVQASWMVFYFPFCWIIAYNKPFGHTSGMLSGLPIAPAFMPSIFLRMGHPEKNLSFVILSLVVILTTVTLTARRSPKATLWMLPFLLGYSGVSSLILHALYRA